MSLFLKKSLLGSSLLINSFEKMAQGNLGIKQNFEKYSYFSHPTTMAYFRLKFNGYSLFKLIDIIHLKKEVSNINSIFID